MNAPCLKCGRTGCMTVNVDDGDLNCIECCQVYSIAEVRDCVEAWSTILPWLLAYPAIASELEPEIV